MISLTKYADLYVLSLNDALQHAADSGISIHLYGDPMHPGGGSDVTVEAAAEAATSDPALVYLTGVGAKTGVTTDELALLHGNGFQAPVLMDRATGRVISHPSGGESEWGVQRAAGDAGWVVVRASDGSWADDESLLPLLATLDRCQALNEGSAG